MSILIQINGEDAEQAIRELSVLAAGIGVKSGVATPATTESPKTDKPSRGSRSASKSETALEKEPQVENKPDPEETDDAEDDGAPIPTVVDLRAKASEVGNSPKGKEAVKALLNKFGSKSISDVPEDKRAAFMAQLEKLAGPIDISDDDLPY